MRRLLVNGLAIAVLLTFGFLSFEHHYLVPTDYADNETFRDEGSTPGLVRSQEAIDSKIRNKQLKMEGKKPEHPKSPAERAAFEYKQRVDDNGVILDNALLKAKAELDQLAENADKDGGISGWEWLGPGNVGGRIRAIAIHPKTPDIMWIGGVSGGIWKTTNGGGEWSPMSDFIANLAVTFIALDPTDPHVLYASTGEGFGNTALRGAGIFKSTDSGLTWAQLSSTAGGGDFSWVNRLAHHPTNADHLFAATSGSLYESTDGGDTWNPIINPIGACQDIRIHPSDGDLMLLGTSSDAYFSDDGGGSFTRITDGNVSTLTSPGRCEVAFATSDVNYFYLNVDINNGEIWRSTDGGATWNQRNTGTNYFLGAGGQGWYDNAIWVRPDDRNFLVVGGIDLWRSTDGGANLTRISRWQDYHTGSSAHADQHAILHHPDFGTGGNLTVYFGNDGGIQTTDDIETVAQNSGWTNLANNLGITQFYGAAAAPDGSVIVGGTQDNDHLRYRPADGVQGWYQAETGDGGFAAVNYDNPDVIYSEFVRLAIEKSTNGGDSYSNSVNGLTDAGVVGQALFIAPFMMDPVDPDVLYAGGQSIWMTTDAAANWSQFKTPETGGPHLCSAIDVAPTDTDVIWIGFDTGRVLRTTNAGGNWTRVDNNASAIPGRFVTDIAISPFNSNHVIVTIGGYLTDTVWLTTDAGATWSRITGTAPFDLPSIQVNTVKWDVVEQDWIYIGTDLGVLATNDRGLNWNVMALEGINEGPVNTRVDDLLFIGDELLAATHGRGMYLTDALRCPLTIASPNGGETFIAGCPITVTWDASDEVDKVNILMSTDNGETWIALLQNTPNDGEQTLATLCAETDEARIMVESADNVCFDVSDAAFTLEFPEFTVSGNVSNTYNPPNPWPMNGLVIDNFTVTADDGDLHNIRFVADPLQCPNPPCEINVVKKLSAENIEFVPASINYLEEGQSVQVEVKFTVPVGQHACDYSGEIHVLADPECMCPTTISESLPVDLNVDDEVDMDVADNLGNVSDNILHIQGAKNTTVSGTFTVMNPNSEVKNYDPEDGPGNIRINDGIATPTDLVKIGDPAVSIPSDSLTIDNLISLASGEAQSVGLSISIPDGLPVNAYYQGTVTVQYTGCLGGTVTDEFAVNLQVLPTQGTLDIVETAVADTFCPPDPWTMVGQVKFTIDVHANGDHRNIRIASGGLKHETLDKKLDDFNFFPGEIAFLPAGDTRPIDIIVKIPIGQHSGMYEGYFRVVSENAGEDSVLATIEICPLYDMDIKDHYANLGDNIMDIQAIGRANQTGGEWTMRAFDIGLPNFVVNNHDQFDGPGNASIACITCEFGEWSQVWHESDHDHHFHNNTEFTGSGSVVGDLCQTEWGSGEFRRMLVGVFVPKMQGTENKSGTYMNRLDCYGLSDVGDTLSHDYFEIQLRLAQIVGGNASTSTGTFGVYATEDGVFIYWGDFSEVGLEGDVVLYRIDPETGELTPVTSEPLEQESSYHDTQVKPREQYRYQIGIQTAKGEVMLGPIDVGAAPASFVVLANAPNPFNPRTTIRFELPGPSNVSLEIYSITGQLVRRLIDEPYPLGEHQAVWDGTDEAGRELGSGIYFYRIATEYGDKTTKMVLVR